MVRATAILVALVVTLSASVTAHHSPAAFDRSKRVTLNGTVKDFRWQNPHTWLEVDVPNQAGVVETWVVEMTSPTYLVRAGWKNNSVKPGDKVSVVVNPVKAGDVRAGIFIEITLPDGRKLGEQPARLGASAK